MVEPQIGSGELVEDLLPVISLPVSSVMLLDHPGELDLHAAGQVEAVLGLQQIRHAALARLAVDPHDVLVGAPDIVRVDRDVRHLEEAAVALLERLETLLDRILV